MNINFESADQRKKAFKFAGRIALILFIGMSVYLFVSAVILVILAKPAKEVMTPNVTGKRFEDVYNSIVRKGLIPEIKFYDVYDMDNGIILSQYPEHGKILYEGEKVKFVVSRNKVNIPVPNLIGTKLPFAINKLKNIHFNDRSYTIGTGVISYIPSDKIAETVILSQSPEAGEEISPERKINLLVSAGVTEENMKMPDVTGQSIDLSVELLLSKGLSISEDIILVDSIAKSGIIESQTPKAEEAIQKGTNVRIKVNYFPQKERPFTSFERVSFTIPSDEKDGIFEAYIEDSKSKRIVFSANMKPKGKLDFIFKRRGTAKVSFTRNRQVIDTITIEPNEFN